MTLSLLSEIMGALAVALAVAGVALLVYNLTRRK